MTDDEAQSTGEFQMRHSHATHDLINAINDGDYPKYDFYIQTLDPKDELNLDFDPLDCTKNWPEEQFPWQPVGRMVIDNWATDKAVDELAERMAKLFQN